MLTKKRKWIAEIAKISDRSTWLAERVAAEHAQTVKRNVEKGLPCGSDRFIAMLAKRAGRSLAYRPRGRPKLSEVL